MKTILVDAVDTFVIEGEGVYQPLAELLNNYPNPKIILTNANDDQMVQFGLVNMPYEMFTLKHMPDKIDPKYFKQMLKEYNLTPNDVIYFEHNLDAIKSAESVGIKSYHWDPVKKDVDVLKVFLDSNV